MNSDVTWDAAQDENARKITSTILCEVRTLPPITAAPGYGSNTLPGGGIFII